MNYLEKLHTLLSAGGRQLKYGVMTEETADGLIALRSGESEAGTGYLGDSGNTARPTVLISVYHSSFMDGFRLLEELKAEIRAAVKDTVHVLHLRDRETKYDAVSGKYELQAQFKIILI